MTTPSIVRNVHYTAPSNRDGKIVVRAAIVTTVELKEPLKEGQAADDESLYTCGLFVMTEDGSFNVNNVEYTTAAAGSTDALGKWTWPARV